MITKENVMLEKMLPQTDALLVLNAVPGCYLILLPDAPRFTIVEATDAYLNATYTTREKIIGRGLFDVFPDNPYNKEATGVKNLSKSLHHVLKNREQHRMADQRYDVENAQEGDFEYKIWRPVNKPVLSKTGNVRFIIHSVEDVTEEVRLEKQTKAVKEANESQRKLLYNLFTQAPVAIAIFRGPQYIVELANDAFLKIWGRTAEQAIGKPLFEVLPEAVGQGYEELLATVVEEGKPYYAYEMAADLIRYGKRERAYFDFVYHPLRDLDGTTSGIIVIATEITEKILARRKAEEVEHSYRTLIEAIF